MTRHAVEMTSHLNQQSRNDNNPEDINTNAEDHAYDALRYGCMSRPMHTSYANRFNKTPRPQFQPADRIFGY